MVSMEGIAQECATFYTASNIGAGSPCKMVAKLAVAPCNDGDDFFGIAIKREGTLCSVIFRGFVTLPYFGTTPSYGFTGLAADGAGGVKVSSTAVKRLVVAIDSSSKTLTLLL